MSIVVHCASAGDDMGACISGRSLSESAAEAAWAKDNRECVVSCEALRLHRSLRNVLEAQWDVPPDLVAIVAAYLWLPVQRGTWIEVQGVASGLNMFNAAPLRWDLAEVVAIKEKQEKAGDAKTELVVRSVDRVHPYPYLYAQSGANIVRSTLTLEIGSERVRPFRLPEIRIGHLGETTEYSLIDVFQPYLEYWDCDGTKSKIFPPRACSPTTTSSCVSTAANSSSYKDAWDGTSGGSFEKDQEADEDVDYMTDSRGVPVPGRWTPGEVCANIGTALWVLHVDMYRSAEHKDSLREWVSISSLRLAAHRSRARQRLVGMRPPPCPFAAASVNRRSLALCTPHNPALRPRCKE